MKIMCETTDLEIDMEEVFAAVNTTYAVVKKIKPEKFGPYEIWIRELCNTAAVLYQPS